MSRRHGTVAPSRFNSFEDWLRMEDAVTKLQNDRGTLSGEGLGLRVIGDDFTWEYIREKCEALGGNVRLDLKDCLVYAFWTCPAFWEVVRSQSVLEISFYADEDDRTGAELIANLTGVRELLSAKVQMLSQLYTEEMTQDTPNIYLKKCKGGYTMNLADAFGASGVMSVADFMLLERSVNIVKERLGENEVVHVDLRPYDIGMVIDGVSSLALDDSVEIEVHGTFLPLVLREMAKMREKLSGASFEDYAVRELSKLVGSVGVLKYEKTSRGYCLPAKLVKVEGGTVLFDVVSPINGSCTDYRRFAVSVALGHLSADDVLAKRSGFHVFLSDRYLPGQFRETLSKSFAESAGERD